MVSVIPDPSISIISIFLSCIFVVISPPAPLTETMDPHLRIWNYMYICTLIWCGRFTCYRVKIDLLEFQDVSVQPQCRTITDAHVQRTKILRITGCMSRFLWRSIGRKGGMMCFSWYK